MRIRRDAGWPEPGSLLIRVDSGAEVVHFNSPGENVPVFNVGGATHIH